MKDSGTKQGIVTSCVRTVLKRVLVFSGAGSSVLLHGARLPKLHLTRLSLCFRHEACMVQDMVIAVRDLETVEFILEPVGGFKVR